MNNKKPEESNVSRKVYHKEKRIQASDKRKAGADRNIVAAKAAKDRNSDGAGDSSFYAV